MYKYIRPGKSLILPVLLVTVIFLFCSAFTTSSDLQARDHKIIATAGPGGKIDPSGEVKVKRYYSQTFTITPDKSHEILDVVVDGESVGPVSSYRFIFVTSNHTISATFIPKTYKITASAGEGGEITPSGEVIVERGSEQSFAIDANPGYEVLDVVVDEDSQGALTSYTFVNIEADHTIHATFDRAVGILDVTIPNESMKVADEVPVTISVNDDAGSSYSLISGSVGGYPLVGLERISSTSYQAYFTINEGGNSYRAIEDIPVSNLVISDGETESTPYNHPIVQDSDPIDALLPVVTRMEVPSIIAGVGDTVIVTISADGVNYTAETGTWVNAVPLSSPRVSFYNRSIGVHELSNPNGLYELYYVVGSEDSDVAPGTLEASIVLKDPADNIGNSYQIVEPNNLEIYTTLPEATLEGVSQICEGEEVQLSVLLTGRSPWSFDLYDGTSTTTFTDITTPEYLITVAPIQSTTYQITSVRDVNGVENTNNGNLQLTVYDTANVEIVNLATGYNVNADAVKLEANVPGGTFSGPGVNSETGYFYPSQADTLNSPHTIEYIYTNDNGCTSSDSRLVYVVGAEGTILIPASTVCKDSEIFNAVVLNIPGVNGSFSLLNSDSQPVPGLIDHGDNTASIDPDSLSTESYTIEYEYFDIVMQYLRKEFSVESVDQPQIQGLSDTSFCQNEAPFILQSNIADVVFEGPGVSGNINDGFTFNPSDTDPGSILITCTAFSQNGCQASSQENLLIKFAPEVKFAVNTTCIPEGGEIASFDNQTNFKLLVESWNWDFGDPGSGENNYSDLAYPEHLYQEPGQKSIILTASSFEGCTDIDTLETIIDSKPVVDFTWISDCLAPESGVKFVNRSSQGSAVVDTIIWTFRTSDSTLLDEIGAVSATDTVAFTFATADRFLVDLYTMNIGGCFGNLTKEIILRPTIILDSLGYNENFDESEGFWTIHSDDQVESWQWGVPDFTGYTQSEDDKAWFTRYPPGEEDYEENSWIQSPCFNFTDLDRPLIRMDMMRSFVPYLDGAVLQYRDVIEEGWNNVGNHTPGIEWYNLNSIVNKPGGSRTGWGSEVFDPDTDWVTAIHDLDQLRGKPNVTFRIAIANNGQLEIGNQGIAVSNVQITERTKLSVLEHFTNSADDTSRLADDIIDVITNTHSKNVIDLQYHVAYQGFDHMNENNPIPPSARSFSYGVPRIPYTILDGGQPSDFRFDFPALNSSPINDHLILLSLENPVFNIDLNVNWLKSFLEAKTTISCLTDDFEDDIQLYLVVFETAVTTYTGANGDTEFRNVVLDMLPTPSGNPLGDNWHEGKTENRTNIWSYQPYVENIEDLAVAAFVQDWSSGRILQAAVDYKNELVSVPDQSSPIRSLEIYPNPADNFIYVNLGTSTAYAGKIELLEMNGMVVLSEHVPAGYQIFQLDIDHLNPGMYLLRWVDSEKVKGVSKLVKMQ